VIAGLSILLALLWLLPFSGGFIHWPADVIISLAWFAVFGLLVDYIHGTDCSSSVFNWAGITKGGVCNRWKASEAFSFLSALFWLVSAIVGIWFVHRTRKDRNVNTGVG
jgi:Membrane-associating domain